MTDSEGILGIGDQGVGGVLISIGKGNIYSLGAGKLIVTYRANLERGAHRVPSGIDPSRILPVVLDVGTDSQQLLYVQ